MRKRLRLFSLLPLLILLFAPAPDARADVVVVTSGSINYDFFNPANSTFTLTGAGLSIGGHVSNALLFSTPPPGGTYRLSKSWVNDPLSVQAPYTVGGVPYTTWSNFENTLNVSITAADFVLPTNPTVGDITFTTPFAMTGFVHLGPNQVGMMTGIRTDIAGEGVATVSLRRSSVNSPWLLTNLNYTFNQPNPVPEPSTLLLFGTGAAALGGNIRRRRRRRGGKTL